MKTVGTITKYVAQDKIDSVMNNNRAGVLVEAQQ